jgi:RNA polymerase sigma factor (TIGR02999 family)
MTRTHEITDLLQAWSNGDEEALAKLLPLIDHELKRIAHAYMQRERPGHTLQTTALVNEALIRLIGEEKISWNSRTHFYSLAARRMRQVLIEHAREQMTAKRGARAEHVAISDADLLSPALSEELLALDEALTRLNKIDERKAKIVEYRYFAGFTMDEIAEILGIALPTVEREWRFARSWLRREMS